MGAKAALGVRGVDRRGVGVDLRVGQHAELSGTPRGTIRAVLI